MTTEFLTAAPEPDRLDTLTRIIGNGRYFQRLPPQLLRNILGQGTLIDCAKDEVLIREGDTLPKQMFILVEGSVAVLVNGHFILRLDQAGDVVGEMGVIQSTPRSADVVTETPCRLVAFAAELFEIDHYSPQASILYVLFSHIMAAKLRITTSQALIRKNQRINAQGEIFAGIVDADPAGRAAAKHALEASWPEAEVMEFDTPAQFLECPAVYRFDLVITEVDIFGDFHNDSTAIANFLAAAKLRGAHILVSSSACNQASRREFLIRQGADDVIAKPCPPFDLQHVVGKARVAYYKNLELDRVETAAETDQLTGLANRRRLQEFLDALVTVYPEQQRSFSLILLDVDHFKFYNDTHGHPAGDAVLASLASLLAAGLRRGDLAARYGGEEFLVVLPDCDKDSALDLAEKLRRAIECAALPHKEQQPGGNLTATFGVASFPVDAQEPDGLVKKADERLYRGKHLGRNVVVASP